MKHALHPGREIPEPSLRRLPVYYRSLQGMSAAGVEQVSCADLARVLGTGPHAGAQGYRDDGHCRQAPGGISAGRTGAAGSRISWGGTGPRRRCWPAPAVWAARCWATGNFASTGWRSWRHSISIPPRSGGGFTAGRSIHCPRCRISWAASGTVVGVIATPAAAAQSVADLMVAGGIRAIWNFAPAHLRVPEQVILVNEDLYHSLASLSFQAGEPHGGRGGKPNLIWPRQLT